MKIWLCDLTHDQQVIASDTMPSNVAYIASYLLDRSKHEHKVKLFKFPGKILKQIEAGNLPDVIGFSHFMWNARLSLAIAEEMKRINPNLIIVFGGLNYPLEAPLQETWMRTNSVVDFHVVKEGEVAFHLLIDAIADSDMDLSSVKQQDLEGVHCIRNDGSFYAPPPAPRVKDLSSIPSPYLTGLMDEFFDGKLMPLMTTNRGCPFTCTFCAEGQSYYNKVTKSNIDRVKAEIDYIGKKLNSLPKNSSRRDVYITDSNFGMYKQDVDCAYAFKSAKEKYGWPEYVKATTGKNNHERIIKVADILDGAMTLAGSVQSLDVGVLTSVKRDNINSDALIKVAKASATVGANSYSDVILALPGDSLKAHIGTIKQLVNAKFDYMALYQLRLQADCEMASAEYRDKFGLKGKYRVLTRSYGSYPFNGGYLNVAEIEEVCTEGKDLPFEDYLRARKFDLSTAIFTYDRFFDGVVRLLDHYGIERSIWLDKVHDKVSSNKNIMKLYDEFEKATIGELWENENDLIDFASSRDNILKFVSAELGANLMGTFRILAVTDFIDDLSDISADAASECLLNIENEENSQAIDLIKDICAYEKERKRGIYEENLEDSEITVQYHIPKFLSQSNITTLADFKLSKPSKLRFTRTDDVIDIVKRNNRIFGTNIMAKYKQWTRTPWKMVYRTASFE